MQFDDDKIYFKCPNCPATYAYKEFFELEHMSEASPADGPNALGHAKCHNCSKEFYYYLTSDVHPIVVDPFFPPEIASSIPDELAGLELTLNTMGKVGAAEPGDETRQTKEDATQCDNMGQFEQALKGIDKNLQPLELFNKISEALDTIVAESSPKIEAAFDLLSKRFRLNARKIEAFRKDLNLKREHIETDRKMKEFHAAVAKFSMPPKEVAGEEEEEALAYLRDPNLFQNISKDIATAGEVLGEETNKMMLYLAATSRKFKKPISLVIFGKSSSGKSYLANAVQQFMPEEDSLALSSISQRALEYMGDQLKHKFILIQEWEGLVEALPTLRTLQSEGKLSRLVTVTDPVTKTRVAKAYSQECPCSVAVTTTKEGIHNENSTRIFELYADEGVEQTEKVVRATIDKADMTKRISLEAKKQILDLHHNVQRLLEPGEVNIPFAEHLSFPAKTTRHRRDSERFLNLIKAVAFLRQKQKGQFKTLNGEKYVDAEFADYRIAYAIGLDVIRATLNNISNRSKDALRVCCELNDKYLRAKKDPLFSVTEIQDAAAELGLDFRNRPDLYKQLDKLEEYEYLERKQARKNAIRYYKVLFAYERNEAGEIINIDLPDIKEILTPEQLQEKLKIGQSGPGAGTEPKTEGGEPDVYSDKFEGSDKIEEPD
jgi:hypothetical protein